MVNCIFVSDIFGRTAELEELCGSICDSFEIIDPYNGSITSFADETDAYKYFQSEVGLDRYSKILSERISSSREKMNLVSFSVGASAVWLISEELTNENLLSTTCYYGSQIRNHLEINPIAEMEMFYPKEEPSFSVDELIHELQKKENLQTIRTEYSHGFMNKRSVNFSKTGYSKHRELLFNKLKNVNVSEAAKTRRPF